MTFSAAVAWWVLAGALVAVELLTGTFYLLALAIGAAAGALAAHAGLAQSSQLLTAALVGGGFTALWHWKRAHQPRSAPAAANRDVHLDIGESVDVTSWDATGHAQVQYRGSAWRAKFVGPNAATPGEHVIVSIQGNQLELAPVPARA